MNNGIINAATITTNIEICAMMHVLSRGVSIGFQYNAPDMMIS
ncbi:hypothetical protein [Lacticaseibacillus pantheris]|nr:hypothetical protein [Lacticaseibacillus pantheris]